jgi:signal transduction histidine kinase
MRILMVTLQREQDVVFTRQRARQIAQVLGFDAQDQTRIATAVSEIARNALTYAGGGQVAFHLEGQTPPQLLQVSISDQGPGIPHLQKILAGQYQSPTGLGLGLRGAQRLMDQVHITSAPGQGTTVWLQKLLPRHAPVLIGQHLHQLVDTLMQQRPHDPLTEVQQQNQELLHTLEALRVRQDDLLRLNRELEDTNRGVVALYAELDEQAEHLRRADELKSRFLSNMSHEFRTPVNSILSLARLLLDHTDGLLTDEQTKQVSYIRTAAEALSELINDLLDLAKIEAGKVTVRPAPFAVSDLFSALRGMLRPLLVTDRVTLVFDEPEALPLLASDEGKVSQILRNFLSNALKFTEQGDIRVSATLTPAGDAVVFAVADTGIGIAPEDQEAIFEQWFGQNQAAIAP